MRARQAALALVMTLAAALPAAAGSLSIMPTRVDFDAERSVQSLLLTNLSGDTVTVETQIVLWPEGAAGQQANDIVVTPAVVTLPPNQRVRVRVGILRRLEADQERAYRIYFTELPAPTPLHAAGIGIRLRVGVPVFVAPAEARPEPLRWTARPAADGWQLEAYNPGNVHVRLADVTLGAAAGSAGKVPLPFPYVLPRSSLLIPRIGKPEAGTRIRWSDGVDDREGTVALP